MYDLMTKKNPMLSLWLSAANSWAGAARGFWTAELQRQQTAMLSEATRQMFRFWSGAWAIPAARAATATTIPVATVTRLVDAGRAAATDTAAAVERAVAPQAQPASDGKRAAQLRSRPQRRPARAAKPASSAKAKRGPAKRSSSRSR
jgi:hypothetical protein